MNKEIFYEFLLSVEKLATNSSSKIYALFQVNNLDDIKNLLDLASDKYLIKYRDCIITSCNKWCDFEISILRMTGNDCYYKICGKSYNLVCFNDLLAPSVKTRIISRSRLLPTEIYAYSSHGIKQLRIPEDLYSLCESTKYQRQKEFWT